MSKRFTIEFLDLTYKIVDNQEGRIVSYTYDKDYAEQLAKWLNLGEGLEKAKFVTSPPIDPLPAPQPDQASLWMQFVCAFIAADPEGLRGYDDYADSADHMVQKYKERFHNDST